MKKSSIILILLLCTGATYGQNDSIVKFKSKICRTFSKEQGEDSLKQTDYFSNHIIILDTKRNRILTYEKTLEFNLDILDILPNREGKSTVTYRFNCLNNSSLKECKVEVTFFENKPFTFNIDFGDRKIMYFLDE